MAINKKRLTKKVWHENDLWDVAMVFEPTKTQTFLLLTITDKDNDVETQLIDCGNDEFQPNTKRVCQLIKNRTKCKEQLEKKIESYEDELTNIWISMQIGD